MTPLIPAATEHRSPVGSSLRTYLARRALLAAVSFALFACGDGGGRAGADTAQAASAAVTRAPAGVSSSLSDADILALFDRANVIDSAAGAIAASKATGTELRSFGAQMVRDHHAMRVEGERVARRLRLTPDLASVDDADTRMGAILTVLNSTARGRDFDKAYLDHEVAFHLDFLETVTGAMDVAGETEVRAFIQRLAPMLQEHLDRAQALQAQLR